MIVVLDACAAIGMVMHPEKHKNIVDCLKKADWVIAPDLFVSEVSNVCWKYHYHEDLPTEKCEQLMEKTIALVDDYTDAKTLYKEAFSLACMAGHSVYDVMYLVLSRRHNAFLITLDKKLNKTAKKHSIKVF